MSPRRATRGPQMARPISTSIQQHTPHQGRRRRPPASGGGVASKTAMAAPRRRRRLRGSELPARGLAAATSSSPPQLVHTNAYKTEERGPPDLILLDRLASCGRGRGAVDSTQSGACEAVGPAEAQANPHGGGTELAFGLVAYRQIPYQRRPPPRKAKYYGKGNWSAAAIPIVGVALDRDARQACIKAFGQALPSAHGSTPNCSLSQPRNKQINNLQGQTADDPDTTKNK